MSVHLVPDGLAGERLDSAAARMTGLSRSRIDELIAAGLVQVDGRTVSKSTRVAGGELLEVTLPERPAGVEVVPRAVAGVRIVHDDADIVVVDKPAGVAAHPSLGWDGPSVTEHLAAAGFRISTSGAQERQGVVQRLDVGTSGLMVVAKSERAYTLLKRAFRDRTVDKVYHALVQGFPDPHVGTIDAPSRATTATTGRWRLWTADGTASPTTTPWRCSAGPPCSRCTWKPGAPIRSACTSRRSGIRVSATRSTAATRCWLLGWGWFGSGCTPSN